MTRRHMRTVHSILERSVTDADGHNEVWIEDPTSCPIGRKEREHETEAR